MKEKVWRKGRKSTSHSHIVQEDYLGLCATERKQDRAGLCLQDAKLPI